MVVCDGRTGSGWANAFIFRLIIILSARCVHGPMRVNQYYLNRERLFVKWCASPPVVGGKPNTSEAAPTWLDQVQLIGPHGQGGVCASFVRWRDGARAEQTCRE